jgi:chorismate synthase
MPGNAFGHSFRITTWGESHGLAIGCMIDGVPPGMALSEADIQPWLDRRRPGQSRHTTQRKEPDKARLLSGVFEGKTTGTPISFVVENQDVRSKDYDSIKDKFRPGHAEYAYWKKYGHYDYRGGGRSSARETAMRVAAGAVARRVLDHLLPAPVSIRGALVRMGPHAIERANWDWAEIENNPFWCPDPAAAKHWEGFLDGVRKAGSSTGAVIEVVASGVPAGLGEPVYDKLDADLAKAMMSINAVKSVEIGAGLGAAALSGEDNADEMRMKGADAEFLSNNAGGVLGGISTGQDVVVRFAVKPTSSIRTPRRTVDRFSQDTEIATPGRHDPCVGIRAVPVGEAMMALVLADHLLRQRGQCG